MCIRISYSRTVGIWTLRGVVERVCLPAGSTVTHDFAGWRFESRRFAQVHEWRTPTTWNLLVNHRRRVDHYHPRRKQISLSPCPARRPSCAERRAHAFDDTGRYQARLEKSSPTGLPVRCLSQESRTTWKTRFRSKTMTQRLAMNKRQEKHRDKMARKCHSIMYSYSRQPCSSIRDSNRLTIIHRIRVVAAIASISIIELTRRENAERPITMSKDSSDYTDSVLGTRSPGSRRNSPRLRERATWWDSLTMAGHGRAVQQTPTHLSHSKRISKRVCWPCLLALLRSRDSTSGQGVLHHEPSFLLRYLDIRGLGKDTS